MIKRLMGYMLIVSFMIPPGQVFAAKESVVLMPLRTTGVDRQYKPSMENAIVEGLSPNFKVFAGERVTNKVREIFRKVAMETEAGKECDDTKCLQDIAIEFQVESIATASIVQNKNGYILTLNVRNVFDDVVTYSKTLTCEGCSEFKVNDRLKEMALSMTEETPAYASLKGADYAKEKPKSKKWWWIIGGLLVAGGAAAAAGGGGGDSSSTTDTSTDTGSASVSW